MRARDALLPCGGTWRLRARTLRAMALLCVAQLLVRLVPFRYWRATLGQVGADDRALSDSAAPARHIAAHIERAALRLPFATKCLPRAMALCWLLRGAGVAYVLKIAARPAGSRQAGLPGADDTLHAWVESGVESRVESGNATVIGALPGPWLVVLSVSG